MNKIGKYVLVFILSLVTFLNLNIYAEEETEPVKYTMTIDSNGGVQGEEFKSTIVLLEDENYAVSGYNEKFLKAPEGKKFAGIEYKKKWKARKDLVCQCVEMVDIGVYNSCKHFCKYCYANYDEKMINDNYTKHNPKSSLLIGMLSEDDMIKVRKD